MHTHFPNAQGGNRVKEIEKYPAEIYRNSTWKNSL